MNIHIIFLIFFIFIAIQSLGAYFQVKNFRSTMKEMRSRGNNLAVGGKKRFINSEFVIMSCDDKGTILDTRVLNGMSIFNRFKTNSDVIGKNILDLLNVYNALTDKKTRRYQAYIQALTLLKNKLEI